MENITVEQLKARVDAGEKLNVLDVREPSEYAEYNLGAKLVPLEGARAGEDTLSLGTIQVRP